MFQLVRSQWDLLVIIVHQNVNPELHQQQLLQARQMDLCKLSAALVPVSSYKQYDAIKCAPLAFSVGGM